MKTQLAVGVCFGNLKPGKKSFSIHIMTSMLNAVFLVFEKILPSEAEGTISPNRTFVATRCSGPESLRPISHTGTHSDRGLSLVLGLSELLLKLGLWHRAEHREREAGKKNAKGKEERERREEVLKERREEGGREERLRLSRSLPSHFCSSLPRMPAAMLAGSKGCGWSKPLSKLPFQALPTRPTGRTTFRTA